VVLIFLGGPGQWSPFRGLKNVGIRRAKFVLLNHNWDFGLRSHGFGVFFSFIGWFGAMQFHDFLV
jgi:hypothetical protein